ncbi:MAG: DUF362 domain-containing protein [Alphaproteobacteria bacterium]|nr:DUF362 domain-containing protein [Alphaproteobacteria bacterium]
MKKWLLVAGCAIVVIVAIIAIIMICRGKSSKSRVYFTSDISADGLVRAYNALNWEPHGLVAVKISTGEPPHSNYLRPELIKKLIQSVKGTIVECNTAYNGARSDSKSHWNVIRKHGFTDIAPVDIQDEEGSIALPVNGGKVLTENYVGSHFDNYDSYIVLSHFKGHQMAGFGGALKNISIGFGSRMGKFWIHSAGRSKDTWMDDDQIGFLEAMADAGRAVVDHLGRKNIVYINVLNRISVDCDCNGNPAEPDIHDIGILASTDPVALDQASFDMVSNAAGREKLMERISDRHGVHTLETAAEIGLGSRKYKLINID